MSKEFYNYLGEKTVEFFHMASLQSGERYILILENEQEVKNYYDALQSMIPPNEKKEIMFRPDGLNYQDYTAQGMSKENLDIAFIPQIEMSGAYLTTLRNIADKKILFIISFNPVDSITEGAENFISLGKPLNIKNVSRDLKKRIKESDFNKAEKSLLEFVLNKKNEDAYNETIFLKEYEEIIRILYTKEISENDFFQFPYDERRRASTNIY